MGAIDVTQDFRRHPAEDLARVYRAVSYPVVAVMLIRLTHLLCAQAREAHPVLKRYENNWLTAELAKQFLQNRRKHAVRQGYIDRGNLKTSARSRRRRAPSVEI